MQSNVSGIEAMIGEWQAPVGPAGHLFFRAATGLKRRPGRGRESWLDFHPSAA